MGSASSKFKKYLQNGDEFAAMQVFQANAGVQGSLDPNASYGESHGHNTALHYAAQHAMKHLFRAFLFELGGNPNKRNSNDETSLHKVCCVRGPAKSPSAEERRYWCVAMLLQWRGAIMEDGQPETMLVNAKDKEGNTALHYSASSGLLKVTQLLLSAKADLFARNGARFTACHLAAEAGHDNLSRFLEIRMIFADILEPVIPPLTTNAATSHLVLQHQQLLTGPCSVSSNNSCSSQLHSNAASHYSDDLDYQLDQQQPQQCSVAGFRHHGRNQTDTMLFSTAGSGAMFAPTAAGVYRLPDANSAITVNSLAINNGDSSALRGGGIYSGSVVSGVLGGGAAQSASLTLDDLDDADRDIISVRRLLMLNRQGISVAEQHQFLIEDLDDEIINECGLGTEGALIGVDGDEGYRGLRAHELIEAKDQLLVETSDMLHVPLFTAEALLREYEWAKTQLLEAWMNDPFGCCEKAGILPPASLLRRSSILAATCPGVTATEHVDGAVDKCSLSVKPLNERRDSTSSTRSKSSFIGSGHFSSKKKPRQLSLQDQFTGLHQSALKAKAVDSAPSKVLAPGLGAIKSAYKVHDAAGKRSLSGTELSFASVSSDKNDGCKVGAEELDGEGLVLARCKKPKLSVCDFPGDCFKDESSSQASEVLCGICFEEIPPWDLINTFRKSSFNNSFESWQSVCSTSSVLNGARRLSTPVDVDFSFPNADSRRRDSLKIFDQRWESRKSSLSSDISIINLKGGQMVTDTSASDTSGKHLSVPSRELERRVSEQLPGPKNTCTGNNSLRSCSEYASPVMVKDVRPLLQQLNNSWLSSADEDESSLPKNTCDDQNRTESDQNRSDAVREMSLGRSFHSMTRDWTSGKMSNEADNDDEISIDVPQNFLKHRANSSLGNELNSEAEVTFSVKKEMCPKSNKVIVDADESSLLNKDSLIYSKCPNQCETSVNRKVKKLNSRNLGVSGCRHVFCSPCWRSYLNFKIKEGDSHNILCPAVGCNILVDVEFIERMVSPEMVRRYMQFDIQAFVERNKNLKWCPFPECGRAVRFQKDQLLPSPKPVPPSSPSINDHNDYLFPYHYSPGYQPAGIGNTTHSSVSNYGTLRRDHYFHQQSLCGPSDTLINNNYSYPVDYLPQGAISSGTRRAELSSLHKCSAESLNNTNGQTSCVPNSSTDCEKSSCFPYKKSNTEKSVEKLANLRTSCDESVQPDTGPLLSPNSRMVHRPFYSVSNTFQASTSHAFSHQSALNRLVPKEEPPTQKVFPHDVDCGNGHFFCWECLSEAHSPASCEQWRDWQRKIAEVRPDELHSSAAGDTAEQAANLLWLVANSKPCPGCSSPIQKNEGCNHMKCSKCKIEFCWVCLESWKKHSSATGGYFRCNRYDAQAKAHATITSMLHEASQRNQEMQQLTHFLQHYNKFSGHRTLLANEQQLLNNVSVTMDRLRSALHDYNKQDDEDGNVDFLSVAVKEVVKARLVLCGCVVLSYFTNMAAAELARVPHGLTLQPLSARQLRASQHQRSFSVGGGVVSRYFEGSPSSLIASPYERGRPAPYAVQDMTLQYNNTLLECLQSELSSLTDRLSGMVCSGILVHRRATIVATTLLTRHARNKLLRLLRLSSLRQNRQNFLHPWNASSLPPYAGQNTTKHAVVPYSASQQCQSFIQRPSKHTAGGVSLEPSVYYGHESLSNVSDRHCSYELLHEIALGDRRGGSLRPQQLLKQHLPSWHHNSTFLGVDSEHRAHTADASGISLAGGSRSANREYLLSPTEHVELSRPVDERDKGVLKIGLSSDCYGPLQNTAVALSAEGGTTDSFARKMALTRRQADEIDMLLPVGCQNDDVLLNMKVSVTAKPCGWSPMVRGKSASSPQSPSYHDSLQPDSYKPNNCYVYSPESSTSNLQSLKRSLLINCAGCPVQSPSTPLHQFYTATPTSAADNQHGSNVKLPQQTHLFENLCLQRGSADLQNPPSDKIARPVIYHCSAVEENLAHKPNRDLSPNDAQSAASIRQMVIHSCKETLLSSKSLVTVEGDLGALTATGCKMCGRPPKTFSLGYPGLTAQQSRAMQKYCTLRQVPIRSRRPLPDLGEYKNRNILCDSNLKLPNQNCDGLPTSAPYVPLVTGSQEIHNSTVKVTDSAVTGLDYTGKYSSSSVQSPHVLNPSRILSNIASVGQNERKNSSHKSHISSSVPSDAAEENLDACHTSSFNLGKDASQKELSSRGFGTRLPDDCDGNLELLIALQMSKLQHLQDESRRRLEMAAVNIDDNGLLEEFSPCQDSLLNLEQPQHLNAELTVQLQCQNTVTASANAEGVAREEVEDSDNSVTTVSNISPSAAAEIAVDYFLKKLSTKEISMRNLNVLNKNEDYKSEKNLINDSLQSAASGSSQDDDSRVLTPKSIPRSLSSAGNRGAISVASNQRLGDSSKFMRFGAHETGRFRYGDLHENGHHLFCGRMSSMCSRQDLRRSQSMSDLRDTCSSCSSELDTDHAHVENPEERAKFHLSHPISRCNGSLDVESDAGDIESLVSSVMSNSLLSNVSVSNTDQGASSEIMGEMESPLTDLEVCGILSNLENQKGVTRSYHKKLSEPSFQLVVDEGTDKDESQSTEHSGGSTRAPVKTNSLRIHISPSETPDELESSHLMNSVTTSEVSNEFESETGIPNSPSLHISGVSICRSPEPRSPKSAQSINSPISPRSLLSLYSPLSPRSPNTLMPVVGKERSSSLTLHTMARSSCSTLVPSPSPEPRRIRSGSYNSTCSATDRRFLSSPHSPLPDYNRTRSSSLIVPGTIIPSTVGIRRPFSGSNVEASSAVGFAPVSFSFTPPKNTFLTVTPSTARKTSLGPEAGLHLRIGHGSHRFRHSISESHPVARSQKSVTLSDNHLSVSANSTGSSISLQPTRASSPMFPEMRLSKSASEYEKSRLVFQFPSLSLNGPLSSILHVEESNLSSDDFHEALFINRSPRSSKRKKSKKVRNKCIKVKDRDLSKAQTNEHHHGKDSNDKDGSDFSR